MEASSRRLRLFVEAVVIVGSVLFAFGLEAFWSDRQQQQEFESLIELLREDVQSNVAELERRHGISVVHLGALDEVFRIIYREVEAPGADSLTTLVGAIYRNNPLITDLAAYESAVGSPAWALVPSDIQIELTRFRNVSFELFGPLQAQAMVRLTEIATRYGGMTALSGQAPPSSPFRADYNGLLGDPDLEAWLTQHWVVEATQQGQRSVWIERLKALDGALAAL